MQIFGKGWFVLNRPIQVSCVGHRSQVKVQSHMRKMFVFKTKVKFGKPSICRSEGWLADVAQKQTRIGNQK